MIFTGIPESAARHLLPLLLSCLSAAPAVRAMDPESVFRNPPQDAKPRVMWMWMGTNLNEAGLTADLEALQQAGFGGTLMFSLADTTSPWPCPIANSPTPGITAFGDRWWQLVAHANRESKRLGLDFGIASGPGYSTTGGPWITPELSMSEICHSQLTTTGPATVPLQLPQPAVDPHANMHYPVWNPATGKADKPVIPARKSFYRDIATLAMPAEGEPDAKQIINLSGRKSWNVPPGRWTIYRFGYTTKGILLQPPQWEANGLECDKLNPDAVAFHMRHVIDGIRSHIPATDPKDLPFVHVDSYEAGTPDWTPRMREEFSARRGYDMTPYLVRWAGRSVGGRSAMQKFSTDYLETIRDLMRDSYYATMDRMLHDAGLTFSSEPYGGPWRQQDVLPHVHRVMTEFWTKKGTFKFGNSDTITWMHANHRNLIEAEAFTGDPADSKWDETPAWIKPIGDDAFCAGINRLVLHRFTAQPWDSRWLPGNAMGRWGTHFDRTQTWWKDGIEMVRYWQRCQALLQWGAHAEGGFSSDQTALHATRRHGEGCELWFVANHDRTPRSGTCRFTISGLQPEFWDPVTGTIRKLHRFTDDGTTTTVTLPFAAAASGFLVFRHPGPPDAGDDFPEPTPTATLAGPWHLHFDPARGGPPSVTFPTLTDWTQHTTPGIRHYSGTAPYTTTFDGASATLLDLGTVLHTARIRINHKEIGVLWTAPWQITIPPGLLRATGNQLEIDVTNVWANRLIGDEQEPPDCEWTPGHMPGGSYLKRFPDWFVRNTPRPSKGRYTFTTWNCFSKNSPLVPSGLLGPVRLLATPAR